MAPLATIILRAAVLVLFAPSLVAIQPSDTWYGNHGGPYYPAFWNFSPAGLSIYTVEGDLMKSIPNTEICQTRCSSSTGNCTMINDCKYYRVTSDGRKNVYATLTGDSSFSAVQAFSMETGTHVGDLETCGFPYNIEYAPHREEIWTHCWSPDEDADSRGREGHPGDEGHLDVFSTNAIGLDHEQIQLNPVAVSGHGHVQLDAALPNHAYATALTGSDHIGKPGWFKIPLNKGRHAKQAVPLNFDWKMCPGGFYRFSLNGYNKHAYLRCMVCCSCGVDEDTGKTCSTRGGGPGFVNITTGPSAGTYKTGHCGHSCENTAADTVGMVEYDLVTETVIGTHEPTHETNKGNTAPLVSSRGDYVVMMGGTGAYTDILKTNGNGQIAVNAGSIATGFKDGGGQSITDCEFVEDDTHNIAIFAATTDNFVVLADMRATAAWDGVGTPPAIPSRQIDLHSLSSSDVADDYKNNAESSSGHGRGAVRSIVWAPGTNKVLINSGKTKELHLITLAADGGIEGATLTKTISGADSRYMVYVDNHEASANRAAIADAVRVAKAEVLQEAVAEIEAAKKSTVKVVFKSDL